MAAVVAAAFSLVSPALALFEDVDVQTQLQYQSFDMKPDNGPVVSHGGFVTAYNFGFRRPLTPLAKLVTNLNMNSSENNDTLGRQQNRTTNFSLSTSETTYTLTGGIDNVSYSSFVTGFNGASSVSTGGTNNYYVNFNWNQPAWPSTNLQYRKTVTTVAGASNYTTNQWIAGAYYEFKPFRVTFDQQTQAFDFASGNSRSRSSTTHRRAGLEFEEKLLPGLTLNAALGRDTNQSSLIGGRSTAFAGTLGNFRLTAIPTPSLLMTVERAMQNNTQSTDLLEQSNNSKTTTYSMRSEMLPGLALNLSHQISDQSGDLLSNISKTTSANIAARLTSDANLSLGWNKNVFSSEGGIVGSNQTSTFGTLQMPIGLDNDLTIDAGTTNSTSELQEGFNGKYAGISLRNRTRSDMAFGIGYRWNLANITGSFVNNQRTNSVDFDMSWFPASNMGINGRLSYSSNNGSSISDYFTPTVDLRWDLTSASTLTLRYNFNRTRQWDWIQAMVLQQDMKGLSGRFTHRLNRDSSIDLTYDFLGSNTGGVQWQRALRLYFTTRL